MKTPTQLTPPTMTVAMVMANILGIVVALATAVSAVGPSVVADIFSHNITASIIAIASLIGAAAAAYKAGAGRSFVQSVDGVTSVEVPTNSTVSVVTPQGGTASQGILDPSKGILNG